MGFGRFTSVLPVTSFGSRAVIPDAIGDPLLITITSGNVTAIGGNFFTIRNTGFSPASRRLLIELNDGTTVDFNTEVSPVRSFNGFTSDTPITSITLTSDFSGGAIGVPINFSSALDNLYVGIATPVPFEFFPGLGLSVLGMGY